MIGHFFVPRKVVQTVSVGSSHTESTAFAATTRRVFLISTVSAYIQIAAVPVATSATGYIPANVPLEFEVLVGESLSVLQTTTGGTLYIHEGEQL